MYFSNVAIDSVVQKLPEIFNFSEISKEVFKGITRSDETLSDAPFPVEPVYWPEQEAAANISSHRGAGASAIVHGGGDGLVVQLNTGRPYASFHERRYLQGMVPVQPASMTVLDVLQGRNLWPNAADSVMGPHMVVGSAAENAATMEKFVRDGHHVEGVAARLLALGLEHALVPFRTRSRVRNAAACYWCTGKYRSDAIIYSLQNVQAVLEWASPNGVGMDNDPTVVVWVGAAEKVRGMSLLSRIMDVGGPMYGQPSYLLRQFDAGRLLMVGTGALRRELRAVEAQDLMDAVNEALWLLVTYNNLSVTFIKNALRLLIRNLPVVDLAQYRESDRQYWRVSQAALGMPVMDPVMEADLTLMVERAFTAQSLAALGLEPEVRNGMFSDLFRRDLLAPGAGVNGLAPATNHIVDWRVLGMLASMQSQVLGAQGGVNVHAREFDVGNPPVLPRMAAFERRLLDGVMLCFSGRAGYHLYGYSAAVAPLAAVIVPPGWQLVAAPPVDLPLPANVPGDGEWLEWIGGNDPQGVAHLVDNTLRAYVVRQWVPTVEDAYLNGYVAPPAIMRRFDVPDNARMAVQINGAWPDLNAMAPRTAAYVAGAVGNADPLDYLTEDGQRNMALLNNTQRSLAFIIGISYCWDACHGAGQQNDAYRRWVAVQHVGTHLTAVPDENKLFLGGIRARKYVEACGGLWTLCFTRPNEQVLVRAGHEDIIEFLRNRQALASYILKLRCAVEMSDQMCRMSNSRIVGCAEPYLWPQAVDARLTRARIDDHSCVDGATYLARQALILSTVFDHPDASVARTFDVQASSTLRLREPIVTPNRPLSTVQHMNWISPQVLKYKMWSWYYGVAAPTFVPDRDARGWLAEGRFSTKWNGVHEHFMAGALTDRQDEIWCAVLTGYVYHDWYPAAMEIAPFGSRLLVDTSRVRQRIYDGYTPVVVRLCLPYETRLGLAVVRGIDLEDDVRPRLACDGVGQWNEGDDIPPLDIQYDGKGRVLQWDLDPNAADMEVIDLRDTAFGSEGIEFETYLPSRVVGAFDSVVRSSGQFWMNRMPTSATRVGAGLCAGAQRLLEYLSPPPPVAVIDDGGGQGVIGAARVEEAAPDVAKARNPAKEGGGDVPLREITQETDAFTLISSLSGVNDEVKQLLMNALAQHKPTSDGKSVASTHPMTDTSQS